MAAGAMIWACKLFLRSKMRTGTYIPISHITLLSVWQPKLWTAKFYTPVLNPLRIDNMKGTEAFKAAIKAYLDKQAANDPLFEPHYKKPGKSIDKCVEYILGEVYHSGCNGFTDETIYGMAIHFFTEDKVEIRKSGDCRVVVNHEVELTEAEKAEARQQAIRQYQEEELRKMKERKSKSAAKAQENKQAEPNLFGF